MLGLIGRKVGMTQVFNETGTLTPVTVIKIDKNVIIGERKKEKEGYNACILGAVDKKESRVSKPYRGQFKKGIVPKKYIVEVRDFDKASTLGVELGVEIFENAHYVDVIGMSKGKGFQGVMKRHGFHGGRKTHGSKFHRTAGSTGMAAWPSRVLKGTKMAGRMGNERKTVQNLRLIKIDIDKQVLLVKGAVPGTSDSMIFVREAKKK